MALKVSEYSMILLNWSDNKEGYRAVQFAFKCDCEMECTSQYDIQVDWRGELFVESFIPSY